MGSHVWVIWLMCINIRVWTWALLLLQELHILQCGQKTQLDCPESAGANSLCLGDSSSFHPEGKYLSRSHYVPSILGGVLHTVYWIGHRYPGKEGLLPSLELEKGRLRVVSLPKSTSEVAPGVNPAPCSPATWCCACLHEAQVVSGGEGTAEPGQPRPSPS